MTKQVVYKGVISAKEQEYRYTRRVVGDYIATSPKMPTLAPIIMVYPNFWEFHNGNGGTLRRPHNFVLHSELVPLYVYISVKPIHGRLINHYVLLDTTCWGQEPYIVTSGQGGDVMHSLYELPPQYYVPIAPIDPSQIN